MNTRTRFGAGLAGALSVAALASGVSYAPSAHAYSDLERFDAQPSTGGSGGRYFTGSPIDGYQCSVCHRGGKEPVVRVRGLPVDGYVPGETYEVEIAWTQPGSYHALLLEMVDRAGMPAGDLSLYARDELDPREHCGSLPTEERASYTVERPGRRILGVRNCDASTMRFRFTAPEDDDVAFSGGIVQSNNSGTAEGDGFASLNIVLKRANVGKKSGGSCSLSQTPSSPSWWSAVFALSGVLLTSIRRRRRG